MTGCELRSPTMGVKDLVRWVKKYYPGVVKEYKHRWAAEELKGRRVAIDATLLTNRFFFADKDTLKRPETTLTRWHGMIKDMKRHGVQPIAVWDEVGERQWKAPEAQKRLRSRAKNIARRMHEDRRRKRLDELQQLLLVQSARSHREQRIMGSILRGLVERGSCHSYRASEDVPTSQALMLEMAVLHVVTTANLAAGAQHILDAYEKHMRDTAPEVASPFPPDQADLSPNGTHGNATHLETKSPDPTDASSAETHSERGLQDPDQLALMDARYRALHPMEYYESPSQSELTEAEVTVWEVAFGISRMAPDDDADDMERADHITDVPVALALLSDLLARAPVVRDIYVRSLDMPLEQHHAACRELLTRMGVPIVIAPIPYEAEGLAATMATTGVADYAGTEDSDVLLYKGPLLRNLSTTKLPLELLDSEALYAAVPLPEKAFRDFCILLGTDASPRIPTVGPMRAFRLVQDHGSIEGVLEAQPELRERIPDVDSFMELVANARKLFTSPPPVPPIPKVEPVSEKELQRWLRDTYGVNIKRSTWKKRHDVNIGAEDWGGPMLESRQPALLEDNGLPAWWR